MLRAVEISIHADEVVLCLRGNLETTCAWTTSLGNPLYGRNMKTLCKTARFVPRAMLLVPFHSTSPVDTKVPSFSVSCKVFSDYKRREVTQGRTKLHNTALHTCHPWHTSLGWSEKDNEMGGACGMQEVLVGKPDGNGHLEDLVADVRITLNAGIRWDGVDWLQLTGDKYK